MHMDLDGSNGFILKRRRPPRKERAIGERRMLKLATRMIRYILRGGESKEYDWILSYQYTTIECCSVQGLVFWHEVTIYTHETKSYPNHTSSVRSIR
jgi:hypothetical protein